MSKEERFEVMMNEETGKWCIKDNEQLPSLLDNYKACVRLNEFAEKVKDLQSQLAEKEKEIEILTAKLEQADEIINNPDTLIFQQQELIDNLQKTIEEKNKEIEKLKDFAKFIATALFDDWNEFCGYDELICRQLLKIGLLKLNKNKTAYLPTFKIDGDTSVQYCKKLKAEFEQQLKDNTKQVCEKIRKWGDKHFNWVGDGTGYDGQDYNEMIGFNNAITELYKFLDQIEKGK